MCPLSRPLSAHEEAVLRLLASDGRPGADQDLARLPHLEVIGECTACPCGSINLRDARGGSQWERQDEFAEASDVRNRGLVHVLIDLDTFRPTCLEYYGGPEDNSTGLPPLEALELLPPGAGRVEVSLPSTAHPRSGRGGNAGVPLRP